MDDSVLRPYILSHYGETNWLCYGTAKNTVFWDVFTAVWMIEFFDPTYYPTLERLTGCAMEQPRTLFWDVFTAVWMITFFDPT
jgi:hypothetical protein